MMLQIAAHILEQGAEKIRMLINMRWIGLTFKLCVTFPFLALHPCTEKAQDAYRKIVVTYCLLPFYRTECEDIVRYTTDECMSITIGLPSTHESPSTKANNECPWYVKEPSKVWMWLCVLQHSTKIQLNKKEKGFIEKWQTNRPNYKLRFLNGVGIELLVTDTYRTVLGGWPTYKTSVIEKKAWHQDPDCKNLSL